MAKFITFEGCEGSGKTTQSKKLYESLKSKGIDTIWTREIGGTEISEKIRDLILFNQMDQMTELLLIMAARSEHLKKLIKPSLENNITVICDRFIDSTLAYQGSILGIDKVLKINDQALDNIMPDITFFVDMPVEIGLQRALIRGDNNKYEDKALSEHQKIYNNFQEVIKLFPDRIVKINGNQEINKVSEEIERKLFHTFPNL